MKIIEDDDYEGKMLRFCSDEERFLTKEKMVKKSSELKKRIISSLIILPVVIFCLWYGGWVFNALILAVMVGLVWEGENLLKVEMRSIRGALLLLWPLCTALSFIKEDYLLSVFLICFAVVFGIRYFIPIAISIVGGISLIWLRARYHGMEEVLFALSCVIASDSFAFFTGRLIGGPKLAPQISPGKTISGSIGGIIGAVIVGSAIAYYIMGHFIVVTVLWAALLAIATQLGDLIESGFKRYIGVKDSGNLIPGHGGLLDRFDGLLLAVPLAAFLALLAKNSFFWMLGS